MNNWTMCYSKNIKILSHKRKFEKILYKILKYNFIDVILKIEIVTLLVIAIL